MMRFIHIKSRRFPILPGEAEELLNEGTYGKALAEYLQVKLRERGYETPFVVCEDWGWWVEIASAPFSLGACVYAGPEEDGPVEYACAESVMAPRKWSWRKFRWIDTVPWSEKLGEDLLAIFRADPEVEIVQVTEEYPF